MVRISRSSGSGGRSSGGGFRGGTIDDFYSEENTPKRMQYWSSKYEEQEPYRDKRTGKMTDSRVAKYYKMKMENELLGTKYGLKDVARLAGEEAPDPEKEKTSWLKKLSSIITSGETGDVAYKQIKARKEGGDFSNIEALKSYGRGVGKGITGKAGEKKTYKDVLKLLGAGEHKLSSILPFVKDKTLADVLPSLYSESGKGIKLKKGGIADPGLDVSDVGVAGTALDIGLDPSTYLTLGTSVAPKIGGKTLSKAGTKTLKKGVKDVGRKQAEIDLAKVLATGGKQADKLVDKGGIKYMGKSIVPGKYIKKAGEKTGLTKAKEAVRLSTPVQGLAKAFKRDVRGTTKKEGFEALTDTLQSELRDRKVYEEAALLKGVKETLKPGVLKKAIKPAERDNMYRAVITNTTKNLSKKARPAVKSMVDELANMAKIEGKKGYNILPNVRENYLPQIYKNPAKAKVILDKLKPTLKTTTRHSKERVIDSVLDIPAIAMAARGVKVPINRKQAEGIIFGDKGKLANNLTFKDVRKGIKEIGLTPETDIAKVFVARKKASLEAIRNIELLRTLEKKLGSKLSKRGVEKVQELADKNRGLLAKIAAMEAGKGMKSLKGLPPEVQGLAMVKNKSIQEAKEKYEKQLSKVERKYNVNRLADDIITYKSGTAGKVRIPRFVAEKLDELEKMGINDEGIKKILNGWNKIQNVYKKYLTAVFPGFHIRNSISNVALNSLDVGLSALNPISHYTANRALIGGKGKVTTKLGESYTYGQLKELMKRHSVTKSGFYEGEARDMFDDKLSKTLTAKGLKAKGGKVIGAPFKGGYKVGSMIENEARALNFITNLKKGLSPEDAAKRTKQFLFDYDNLSQFEKNVMRTAIPFYTFTRKNLELQLKMLVKKPGATAAQLKAIRGFGEPISEDEKGMVPDFIREQLGVKKGVDKYGRPIYYSGLGLPIEETMQKLSGDRLKNFMGMLSPIIKVPIEKTTGKDIFREKDIKDINKADDIAYLVEKLPGEQQRRASMWLDLRPKEKSVYVKGEKVGTKVAWTADPQKLWLLRQLPTSRLQTTLGYVGNEEMSDKQKLMKILTGIKGYAIDEETQKYFAEKPETDALTEMLKRYGIIGQESEASPPYIKEKGLTEEAIKTYSK